MESLVGYESDDEVDERYEQEWRGGGGAGAGAGRREDDTNYDDVTMDMSEDSNNNESDRELPQADAEPQRGRPRHNSSSIAASGKEPGRSPTRDRDRRRDSPGAQRRRDERESRDRRNRDRERSPRRDQHRDRNARGERSRHGDSSSSSSSSNGRRTLLAEKAEDANKMPALMDLKPFGGEAPPAALKTNQADTMDSKDNKGGSYDRREREKQKDRSDRERETHRDKEKERDRERETHREKEKERDREREAHREKERHGRRSQEKKSKRRSRSRSRERRSSHERGRGERERAPLPSHPPAEPRVGFPPRGAPLDGRGGPAGGSPAPGDYRPSSYKVSKKLQVMEKMGLQIKTPDGSMATAQQLMQRTVAEQQGGASGLVGSPAPSYYNNPNSAAVGKQMLSQLQKRKLLWSHKAKEAEVEVAPAGAAKWTGTKFAQDTDGKVANKFMRLMGIKDPNAVQLPKSPEEDLNKKQEEMFEAMQAQYDVARATTHTMRGVGLGFQRHY